MTVIDYKSQTAAEAQQHAAEQQKAENDAAWQDIINTYAVRDIAANRHIVEDYSGGILSLEAFKYLVSHMPKGFTLVWSDEKTLKRELIDAIFERSSQNGAIPEYSKASMAGWSLRQLRARLDEIVRRQHFNQFPADTLKAAIQEQRKKEDASKWYLDKNGACWPRLFSNIVPPGSGFVTAMSTAEYFRQVIKTPAGGAILRDFVRKHGQEQVNNFLNS